MPGACGEITVTIPTKGLVGATTKSIRVTSNDVWHRTSDLRVSAVVQPEFIISNQYLDFGNVSVGETIVKTISLRSSGAARPISVKSTDASIDARLECSLGMDGIAEVIASSKRSAKQGTHYGIIIISTSSRFTPEIRIFVRGTNTIP